MNVRLQRSWTDGDGIVHTEGSSVEVDAVTLAQLESSGVVAVAERSDQSGRQTQPAVPAVLRGPQRRDVTVSRMGPAPGRGDESGSGGAPEGQDDTGAAGDGSVTV